jgi:hypothetical protein
MAKNTIIAECHSTSSNKQNSLARFAVDTKTVQPAKPGEPPAQVAKIIVTVQFDNPEGAMEYKVGKIYSITIQE